MLTPLFPKTNEKVTMSQGNTGDCFILASLDCIINSSPQGLDIIKSMFHQVDGGVEVRIKRNKLFQNLIHHKESGALWGKYHHKYDPNQNEDVFSISNSYLNTIDNEKTGVKSNSLAVKILERIITYYYKPEYPASVNDSKHVNTMLYGYNSIQQHNRSGRTKSAKSETDFLGTIFGIETFDINASQMSSIIAFKQKHPSVPLYINMYYDETDSYSNQHERHALNVKEIRRNINGPGQFEFILINPWDNTKTEKHNLSYIKNQSPKFAIYNINPELRQEICTTFSIAFEDNKLATHPLYTNLTNYNYDTDAIFFDALMKVRNNEETQETKDRIKNFSSLSVNAIFLKKIVDECKVTDGFDLMLLIYKIHADNNELAKVLFKLTKDNLPSLVKPTMGFYITAAQVSNALNTPFKFWFNKMAAPTYTIPGAQDTPIFTSELIDSINTLEVVYSRCRSENDVTTRQRHLTTKLQQIVNDFSNYAGFPNPLSIELVKQAYESRLSLITSKANNYLKEKLIPQTLSIHRMTIENFSYSFDGLQSAEQISNRKFKFILELHNYRYQKDLVSSLKLMDPEYTTQIDSAYELKKTEITAASDKARSTLLTNPSNGGNSFATGFTFFQNGTAKTTEQIFHANLRR